MSAKEAAVIACRALSVYLLFWLVLDLTYLPGSVFAYLHHQLGPTPTNTQLFYRNYDLLSLCFLVCRIIALFFAVQWFYRAGPRLQAYFLAPPTEETEEVEVP